MSWRPIETAPKGGTVIEVRFADRQWKALWRIPVSNEPQWNTHRDYEWREEGTGCWATPTEWRRLAPPSTEGGEDGR